MDLQPAVPAKRRLDRFQLEQEFDDYPDSFRIRPREAAQYIGISLATFWRMVGDGRINIFRVSPCICQVSLGECRRIRDNRYVGA